MAGFEVGQRLKRREPQDDGPWNLITVRGFFDGGPDGGGVEVVVSPAGSFETPVCATGESLLSAYTLDVDNAVEAVEEVEARLAKVTAPPWQTAAEEVQGA